MSEEDSLVLRAAVPASSSWFRVRSAFSVQGDVGEVAHVELKWRSVSSPMPPVRAAVTRYRSEELFYPSKDESLFKVKKKER